MMKVHKAWIVALALGGAGGFAVAGPGCDDKWADKDAMHDEVPPPKVAAKADAAKAASPVAAKETTKVAAKTPAADATAKPTAAR